jgi:hypothetical protein
MRKQTHCSATLFSVISTQPLSRVQKHSSGSTVECSAPPTKVFPPLMPTSMLLVWILMASILDVVPGGTGMQTDTSCSVCVQLYLSVLPPSCGGSSKTRQVGGGGGADIGREGGGGVNNLVSVSKRGGKVLEFESQHECLHLQDAHAGGAGGGGGGGCKEAGGVCFTVHVLP